MVKTWHDKIDDKELTYLDEIYVNDFMQDCGISSANIPRSCTKQVCKRLSQLSKIYINGVVQDCVIFSVLVLEIMRIYYTLKW